jgi:hypothetical protein
LLSLARHSIGIVFQGLVFNGMAVQAMGKQRTGMAKAIHGGATARLRSQGKALAKVGKE